VASFARPCLAHCTPASFSCDVSLVPDTTRKAPRVCLFLEIHGWRLEVTMLGNMGQLLSVSSSSARRVLQSFREASTAWDTKGRWHQSCSLH